jgi:hypothetical protein
MEYYHADGMLPGIIGSMLLGWLSRRISIKRRLFKIKATLEGFYALYIVEHQLSTQWFVEKSAGPIKKI